MNVGGDNRVTKNNRFNRLKKEKVFNSSVFSIIFFLICNGVFHYSGFHQNIAPPMVANQETLEVNLPSQQT